MKYLFLIMFFLSVNESYARGYKLWQDASGRWNYKCTGSVSGHDSEFDFTKNSYAKENAEKFCLGRSFNGVEQNFNSSKDFKNKNFK